MVSLSSSGRSFSSCDCRTAADTFTNAKHPAQFCSLPVHSADLVAEFASNWVLHLGHNSFSNGTCGRSDIIIYDFAVVYYCI